MNEKCKNVELIENKIKETNKPKFVIAIYCMIYSTAIQILTFKLDIKYFNVECLTRLELIQFITIITTYIILLGTDFKPLFNDS